MKINFYLLMMLSLAACSTHGQEASEVTAAGTKLFSALSSSQKKQATYQLKDSERFNWHYIPRDRKGIAMKDLDSNQRELVRTLLAASLSVQGSRKAESIVALEDILRNIEGRPLGDAYRDQTNYSVTFFGEPSIHDPWGWRFEGHHLSLNFSSSKGFMVSSTPSFFGSNPAIVPTGDHKGLQVLKDETTVGFQLLNSLSEDQLQVAWVSKTAPGDILTRNDKKASAQEAEGIKYSDLNENQKALFDQLLAVYINNYQLGFAKTLSAKVEKAGKEKLMFAWAGSLKAGSGHYYRIQGPTLIIEYDNTQNGANHVHTVVRDLTNDFAEDILKEHYLSHH